MMIPGVPNIISLLALALFGAWLARVWSKRRASDLATARKYRELYFDSAERLAAAGVNDEVWGKVMFAGRLISLPGVAWVMAAILPIAIWRHRRAEVNELDVFLARQNLSSDLQESYHDLLIGSYLAVSYESTAAGWILRHPFKAEQAVKDGFLDRLAKLALVRRKLDRCAA